MHGGLRSACSLVIVLTLAGCAGSSWQFWKTSESSEAPADPAVASTPESAPAPVAPAAVTTATPTPPAETPGVSVPSNGFTEVAGLADVRFRRGQVGVVKADFKTLDSVVRYLKDNPGAVVMVEGHTDDQGSREDNLAVGEKRATSVMRYLVARGLEPTRISTTSVGSERPVCVEKTDTCRARNRRARFLVKQQ